MSCIKFPSSKSDFAASKSSAKEADYAAVANSLIAKANQLFGERNWSHAISSQTVDFIDYVNGKYQAGCVSIVRIQLTNGIFHEDMGYNSSEGSSKGSAIQRVRLGSYNAALKKVLACFESDVFSKETQPLNRSNSPAPTEPKPKNVLIASSTNAPAVSNKLDSVQFEDIPMSQTDALMDIVDLDQICGTDQNFKPTASTLKVVTPVANSAISTSHPIKNEAKVDPPKIVLTSVPKPEVTKPVVYTAMTEEEMRQERKRKQREMQEEFKRKEEIKRKCVDNGNVPMRNARY